jgi:TonB-dependent SusC/RagA subfamily outer membrane receptor
MDGPTSTNGFAEPLLVVDGASVSPPPATSSVGSYSGIVEYLNGISPIDVDFIEILRGAEAANYGVRGGNGVIIVNTLSKKREVNFGSADANLTKFYGKGISNPVLFPVVDYAPKDKKTIAIPDTRSTLFWNGNYVSDNAHNATITFYTSDVPATYKATVRGVTIHGDIIYKTIIFQSK